MILGIGAESGVFLYAVLAGASVLYAYRILAAFRKLVRHNLLATGLEDMFFWIGTSIYFFCKMYDTTYGSIRWFFVLGVLGGAGAAFLVLRVWDKICAKAKKSLEKYREKR